MHRRKMANHAEPTPNANSQNLRSFTVAAASTDNEHGLTAFVLFKMYQNAMHQKKNSAATCQEIPTIRT